MVVNMYIYTALDPGHVTRRVMVSNRHATAKVLELFERRARSADIQIVIDCQISFSRLKYSIAALG